MGQKKELLDRGQNGFRNSYGPLVGARFERFEGKSLGARRGDVETLDPVTGTPVILRPSAR